MNPVLFSIGSALLVAGFRGTDTLWGWRARLAASRSAKAIAARRMVTCGIGCSLGDEIITVGVTATSSNGGDK